MEYLTRNDNRVIVITSPPFRTVIIGKAVNVDPKFLTIKNNYWQVWNSRCNCYIKLRRWWIWKLYTARTSICIAYVRRVVSVRLNRRVLHSKNTYWRMGKKLTRQQRTVKLISKLSNLDTKVCFLLYFLSNIILYINFLKTITL